METICKQQGEITQQRGPRQIFCYSFLVPWSQTFHPPMAIYGLWTLVCFDVALHPVLACTNCYVMKPWRRCAWGIWFPTPWGADIRGVPGYTNNNYLFFASNLYTFLLICVLQTNLQCAEWTKLKVLLEICKYQLNLFQFKIQTKYQCLCSLLLNRHSKCSKLWKQNSK